MNTIRSFRIVSVTAVMVLTLGLTTWVSAQPASHKSRALQAATVSFTPTPIDVSIPVPLTMGQEAQSPLDSETVYQRLFKFKGTANQLVTVTSRVITGNLSLRIGITDQAGAEIASMEGKFVIMSQLTIKLPQDGNYVINVGKGDPGSGDFEPGTIGVSVAPASMGDAATSPK